MGANNSKIKTSTNHSNKDLELLASSTVFSAEEIKTLCKKYESLSKQETAAGVINMEEFQKMLGVQSIDYTKLIFNAFDTKKTGEISFNDFVSGLSAISPRASTKEKARFVFNMFDLNKDGHIDRNELKQLLEISLGTNNAIQLLDSNIEKIIDATFSKIDSNNDGMITFEDFEAAATNNPSILSCITFSVDGLFPN